MIIGHQKIREKLLRSIEKNTFVQTYLFVGPESVGKFDVAKEFALRLIGGNDAIDKQTTFAKATAWRNNQNEIDLFVLEPERETEKGIVKEKDISVERTREVIHWLGSFPYASHKKVLIIRDAHRLTEGAQNALLKVLEEPPVYAVIILVTHQLGKILTTTLSRCQQISFQLVSSAEIAEGVACDSTLNSLPTQNKFLLEFGRPGLIVQSLRQEAECTQRLMILEKLTHLSENPLRDRLTLSEVCVKNMMQTMQLLMWWVGGLHNQITVVSPGESVSRLMNIEKIEKLRSDLKRFPSSARLLLDTFFLHW
jgi:DNA polymerase-3 subunit delta'